MSSSQLLIWRQKSGRTADRQFSAYDSSNSARLRVLETDLFEHVRGLVQAHAAANVIVFVETAFHTRENVRRLNNLIADFPLIKVVYFGSPFGDMEPSARFAGQFAYLPASTFSSLMGVISGLLWEWPVQDTDAVGHTSMNKEENRLTIPRSRLTKRQSEILSLLGLGMSNKEIGTSLRLSVQTVKAHVSQLMKQFNVKNRTQCAMMAASYAPTAGDTPPVATG